MIPRGYQIEETDEPIMVMGTRRTRAAAERLAAKPPVVPSYRLVVKKVGFLKYEVVAYQNRLVKN